MNNDLDSVIEAFVSAAGVAVTGLVPATSQTWKVYDGPQVTGADPPYAISIGHTEVLDEPAARIEDSGEGQLAEWTKADRIIIRSVISAKSGSSSPNTIRLLRSACWDALVAIRKALVGEQPLLDGVANARIDNLDYIPANGADGSGVQIEFETVFSMRTALI